MTEVETLTVHILREIRDELVNTRTELSARIDETNTRVGHVEEALLDLATQQRFLVRHVTGLSARDRALETDVDELRARVDAIEKRLPG